MAATITNFIDRIQLGNDETHQIAIGSSAYGVCNTAAGEAAKTADIPGFSLNPGTTVHIKFNNANSATSPTLNISSTGAKPIIQYDNTPVGTIDETTGWQAGAILTLTYDGTSWVRDQGYNTNTWNALSTSQAGYVSQAPNDTTKFLRGDASWATLPAASDSTAGIMKLGATGGAATYSHVHGNINNNGTIGTANAARAVVTNASNQITTDNFAQDSPNVPTSGTTTALEFIDTVSQDSAGKITATKKGIKLVSKDNAGLAPKGAQVNTQSQSTKFLREDGSWAVPSYTENTDHDTKVTQTGVTDNQELSILLKNTNNTTDETTSIKYGKTTDKLVTVNPSTGKISAAVGNFSGNMTIGGNLNFSAASRIDWDQGTVRQRLLITDDSTTDTAVFTFQQSTNTGSAYTSLFTIKDNGTVVATTFSGSGASLTSLNASNIDSGTLNADRLATSGATAGSYGDSTTQTPGYGSTFKVPYITVDNKGRVTGISEHTVKIPASDNTNTTYTIATGDSNGQIKVTPSSGNAYNVNVKGLGSAAYTPSTDYSYKHLSDYDFTMTQPLSKYVTFDKSKPVGAPEEVWYNGFVSSHSNYHASYIINSHSDYKKWYVGHNIWHEADNPHAAAPTWYLLAHSGNVDTGDNNGQIKIAGVNVSVKGLGSAAYTESNAYATSGHNHNSTYVTAVGYDSTNKKIYYTKNGANTDVVTFGSNAFNSTSYLPLAGGNMTGNIGYTDGTNAKTMIQFVTGNVNGHTIKIGGGAATVVAAGESVSFAPTATSENLFLLADSNLYIEANANTLANRLGLQINTSGHIIPTKAEGTNNKKQNLGASNNTWATVYGNTFDGAVLKLHQGTAADPSSTSNARIEFDYTSGQPVYIAYTPNDSYHAPAGLKIMGNGATSGSNVSSPAWLEVEGIVYATGFSGSGAALTNLTPTNLTGVVSTTAKKFLKDTGAWVQVDWRDLTNTPTTLSGYGIADALSSSTIVNRVKQSAVTSNLDYTLLFSAGDPNVQNSVDPTSGEDQEAAYYTGLTFNPNSKTLSIYNGSTTGTLTATEYSGNAATATEASSIEWTNVNNKPNIVNSIQVGSSIKTGALTLADLGLANAMHFIGVVASNSANTPSDGTGGYPTIQGLSSYTPADGDVVIDKDLLREYVWNGSWILLGFTASSIYDSNNIAVSETAVNVPTWVSRIQQATDGKITIERETIGTLPVNHGGTGVTSFTNDCVIVATGSTQTLVSRALKVTEDSSSNLTITNNEANKNITISANGTGTMSIGSTTGILTISSTTGKLTVSSNYGSLVIQGGKNIKSTLTLGNATKSSSATGSEGSIVLYSADTKAHTIVGASTTANYTHTLPKQTGWFVSAASSGVATDGKTLIYIASTGITTASTQTEGSGTQPVYLNSGALTALTYTANRLYYSASTSSFEETNHTATADTLALHKTSAITSGYTFEVNGKTNLLDDLTIASGKNIDIGGNIQISGNIIPTTDQTSVLGSNDSTTPKRWSALYIGTADTYGSTTRPIWWDNGVPKALTFTANRLYYSASSTSFTATDHYATSTQLILNAPSSVSGITDTLYVNGTTYLNNTSYLNGNSTIAGNFVPSSDNSYDLGSSGTNACTWKNIYVKTADLDNIDALSSTITIGYNNTSSINMYYSGIANTHTNIFSINDTGIVFPTLNSAGNSPKISWSGANDDATIYYKVATVNNANVGRLVINTNDSSCLIAFTQNNTDKIYINTNTPSIYPQTTNKGTLGTTNNRWQKVYIGTANSYGDAYTPIYWNNGVPAAVTTIQREAFSFTIPAIAGDPSIINSDSTNVTDNSEVVEIVVETGIQYLNSTITWEIVNGNNNTKQIQLTATVTGTVTGYILFRK